VTVCKRSISAEIGAQPRLVDLPITVFTTIEQHDWDPVPELGAQRRTASIGLEIDIGDGQLKSEVGGQLPKPGCCALTQRAPVASQ
jgi:hypothetical protein